MVKLLIRSRICIAQGGTSFCIALCQQVKFATGEFWIWKHRVSLERDQAARINLWTLAG